MHNELPQQVYDMDYVLLRNGNIYRVLGNVASSDGSFLGYNVYSPDCHGDRSFRGIPYRKNYTEDQTLTVDVLDTYELLWRDEVVEYFEPLATAKAVKDRYEGTLWERLYTRLVDLFGAEAIGIFGSALPNSGLQLTPDGNIRNDLDFFIEGLDNVPILEKRLAEVRESLGFTDYTLVSQRRIITTWANVFRNPNCTLVEILQRRWSGMQCTRGDKVVLNTFRFRDKGVTTPPDLLSSQHIVQRSVCISGVAADSVGGNLYPRTFTLHSERRSYPVYCFWWKLSSPVREDDHVTVCGDVMNSDGQEVLRLTNYQDHYIHL
jgi:hypothetical protein